MEGEEHPGCLAPAQTCEMQGWGVGLTVENRVCGLRTIICLYSRD